MTSTHTLRDHQFELIAGGGGVPLASQRELSAAAARSYRETQALRRPRPAARHGDHSGLSTEGGSRRPGRRQGLMTRWTTWLPFPSHRASSAAARSSIASTR